MTFNRAYNLNGGSTLTYSEMVEAIFRGLHTRPRIVRLPLTPMRTLLGIATLLPRYPHVTAEMDGPAPLSLPSARSFTWQVWAATTAVLSWLVATYGVNAPYGEEWELVPFVTGDAPVTAGWLWSQHNGHRIALPRLLYLGLAKLTAGDFRAGMFFNVVILSGIAIVLVLAAGRARGRAAYTDAFFPLALLHPGHAENLLWSFQIRLVVSTAFLCLVLAAINGMETGLSHRRAVSIGFALLALSLCGANGVVLTPVLGAWLGYLAVERWRSRRSGEATAPPALLAALALAAWGVALFYLLGYRGNPGHPRSQGFLSTLAATTEFLSMSLGPAGGAVWPLSAAGVIVVVAISGTALACSWLQEPAERTRTEGFLAFLVAFSGLALAVGWGRSGFGRTAALAGRYSVLAAPLLCWAYLACCRGGSRSRAAFVQICIFVAACAGYFHNVKAGMAFGRDRREKLQAFVDDVGAGLPLGEIAARHSKEVYPDPGQLTQWLQMLRKAEIGPFAFSDERARFKRLYPFIEAPLVHARQGLLPLMVQEVDGQPVLMVHAAGELYFDVPKGAQSARGRFGLMPFVYTKPEPASPPRSDGTYFTVTFKSKGGDERELFSRFLDPRQNARDQGMQEFTVSLPSGEGWLILGTHFGPPGSQANGFDDWSYWRGIEIK